jgi:hypothetical protein
MISQARKDIEARIKNFPAKDRQAKQEQELRELVDAV